MFERQGIIGLGSIVAVFEDDFPASTTGQRRLDLGGFFAALEGADARFSEGGMRSLERDFSGKYPSSSGDVGLLDSMSLTRSLLSCTSDEKAPIGLIEAGFPDLRSLPSFIRRYLGPLESCSLGICWLAGLF